MRVSRITERRWANRFLAGPIAARRMRVSRNGETFMLAGPEPGLSVGLTLAPKKRQGSALRPGQRRRKRRPREAQSLRI